MKWVTREEAKVDRIACPWLITRFVDHTPEFLFVPSGDVLRVAREAGAIPFDTPGAELHHFEEKGYEYVSFDAILRKYHLEDPALDALAQIGRSADAEPPDAVPEGAGLEAAGFGFRAMTKDDPENMRPQFPLYDASYAYGRWRLERGGQLEHAAGSR